jgi:hypothetical protein
MATADPGTPCSFALHPASGGGSKILPDNNTIARRTRLDWRDRLPHYPIDITNFFVTLTLGKLRDGHATIDRVDQPGIMLSTRG